MSIKTYFAGVQAPEADEYINEKGLHRLLSYWNDKRMIKKRYDQGLKTFLDSGAYTAWTKDAKIDVDEYIEYVNKYDEGLDYFMQIDVIPGKKGYEATPKERWEANLQTWENFKYMHNRVKSPEKLVPVFHAGSDVQQLKKILGFKPKVDLIAIGNIVGATKAEKIAKLDVIFNVIKGSENPNVKVHALGVQDFSLSEMFPLYSADASSWIMVSANGSIMSDKGPILVSEKSTQKKQHFVNQPKAIQDEILKYIEQFGYTMEELSKEYKKRTLLNIKYLEERSKRYECKYGQKRRQKTLF